MLHQKIIDAIPSVKKKVASELKRYVGPNHKDNFTLVAVPVILDEFMNIVVEMTMDELCEDDWWSKGFPETNRISSQCIQHKVLEKLCFEIAGEIYDSIREVS